jgi:hypothetical protein
VASFSLPDRVSAPTKFADFLELSAVCAGTQSVPTRAVIANYSMEQDEEEKDWAEEDTAIEGLLLAVQDVILRRAETIGAAYPFRTNDSGGRVEFSGVIDEVTSLYLFPLILSHAYDRTIIGEADAPKLTNDVRNWFQSLSTIAAGGFVDGEAVSFGWPRPDRSGFVAALKSTYSRFGEGKPLDKPRPGAPKNIKDGGIDIIAWRPSIDGLPGGKIYLLGQVASGRNWTAKSVKLDATLFHKHWFSEAPATDHKAAMFMPFALEPEDPSDPATKYEELLKDYASIKTDEFGDIFYRDRLSHYALRGKNLIEAGNKNIDGSSAVSKIRDWVAQEFSVLCGPQAL